MSIRHRALPVVLALAVIVGCSSGSAQPTPTTVPSTDPSTSFEPAELAEIVDEVVTVLQPQELAASLYSATADRYVSTGVLLDLRTTVGELLMNDVAWVDWEPGVGALLLGQPIATGPDSVEVAYTRECGYDVNGEEPLCASGGYVELIHVSGHWEYVQNVETWIS